MVYWYPDDNPVWQVIILIGSIGNADLIINKESRLPGLLSMAFGNMIAVASLPFHYHACSWFPRELAANVQIISVAVLAVSSNKPPVASQIYKDRFPAFSQTLLIWMLSLFSLSMRTISWQTSYFSVVHCLLIVVPLIIAVVFSFSIQRNIFNLVIGLICCICVSYIPIFLNVMFLQQNLHLPAYITACWSPIVIYIVTTVLNAEVHYEKTSVDNLPETLKFFT
ncbi:hypothetical protein C0J52_28116 [Blattella germanica]|nr:hypothetical protein C0J52_28116 [Blattella germanica]